jgi:hypothetical protein
MGLRFATSRGLRVRLANNECPVLADELPPTPNAEDAAPAHTPCRSSHTACDASSPAAAAAGAAAGAGAKR